MSSKPQVGGYIFRAEIARGIGACRVLRQSLRLAMDDATTNLTRARIGRAAIDLAEIEDALTRLHEIVFNTKELSDDNGKD